MVVEEEAVVKEMGVLEGMWNGGEVVVGELADRTAVAEQGRMRLYKNHSQLQR